MSGRFNTNSIAKLGLQAGIFYNNKRIYKDNEEWINLINILRTDDEFENNIWQNINYRSYLSLIIIHNIRESEEETNIMFNIENENILQTENNKFIMFKYIEYGLNKKAEVFNDLFNSNQQSITEFSRCFIDLIIDTYSGQINTKRQKDKILDGKYICEKCKYSTKHFKGL